MVLIMLLPLCASLRTPLAPLGSLAPRAAALRHSRSPAVAAAMDDVEERAREEGGTPSTLEAKMASWEATDEERAKATLGGVVPGQMPKIDGFDAGMYSSAVVLLPLAIILGTFPFWIGNIDVSSVGPPPSQ